LLYCPEPSEQFPGVPDRKETARQSGREKKFRRFSIKTLLLSLKRSRTHPFGARLSCGKKSLRLLERKKSSHKGGHLTKGEKKVENTHYDPLLISTMKSREKQPGSERSKRRGGKGEELLGQGTGGHVDKRCVGKMSS